MPLWKKNLYAIWIAEFLAIAGFATSTPIIPFYLQELGLTDPVKLKVWVGLCQGGPSLTLAFFAPIWGRLADSYGRKMMLLRALFGGTIIMALLGLTQTPGQILILRLIQGTITGTVAAATVLVVSLVPRDKAGFSLGMLQMAIFLGSSVGPMIGGFIADAVGNRVAFFVTSLLLLAGAVIILIAVHEEFLPRHEPGGVLKALIPDFSPLRASGELAIIVIVAGCAQMANTITTPILPLFVQTISPPDMKIASMTGLIFGAAAFSSAVSAAGIGKISYRMGYRRTLLLCLLGSACFTIPQAVSSTPGTLLVFRLFGGIFLGGTMPSINAMVAVRVESGNQGTIYGLISSFTAGGSALGPVLGSALAVAFGYPASFLGTGGILIMAFLIIFIFTRARSVKGSEG